MKVKSLTKILAIGLLSSCASLGSPRETSYETNTGDIRPSTQVINPDFDVSLFTSGRGEYFSTKKQETFNLNGQEVKGIGIARLSDSTIYQDHTKGTITLIPNHWSVLVGVDAKDGNFILESPENQVRETVDFKGIKPEKRNVDTGFGFSHLKPEDLGRKDYDMASISGKNYYITRTSIQLVNPEDPNITYNNLGLVFYEQKGTQEFTDYLRGTVGLEGLAYMAVRAELIDKNKTPLPEETPETISPKPSD